MSNSRGAAFVEQIEGQKIVVIQTNNGPIYISAEAVDQGLQRAARKQWKPLTTFTYPTRNFAHDFEINFPGNLIFNLHRSFRDRGYTRFTSLLNVNRDPESVAEFFLDAPAKDSGGVLKLVSQQGRYLGAINTTLRQLWDRTDEAAIERARVLQQEVRNELVHLTQRWAVEVELLPQPGITAYEFTYDPETSMLRIKPKHGSTDPADYQNRVTTTSELLEMFAAQAESVLRFINLDTVLEFLPLHKFCLAIIDGSVDLAHVRVDVLDGEVWDYMSPPIEQELRDIKARGFVT